MTKPPGNLLAFIPARGGSQRLPGKNSLPLAGKPLIAWTIAAALESGLPMDVIVSTDDGEIAEIAETHGAEVPFLRPAELASATASTFTALAYTLDRLAAQGRRYEYLLLLQPTSPLRQAWHVREAWQAFQHDGVRSVISVSELEHPSRWTLSLGPDHAMDAFIAAQARALQTRSQDMGRECRLNGAIYLAGTADVLCHESFYLPHGSHAYVMDKRYSVDIDDRFDFEYAEFLMSRLQGSKFG